MKPKLESQILAASMLSMLASDSRNEPQSATSFVMDALPRMPDPIYGVFGEQNPKGRYVGEQHPKGYRKKIEKKNAKKKQAKKLRKMNKMKRKG